MTNYTIPTITQNGNGIKKQRESYDTRSETEIRFGSWHGSRYSTFPRAFRKHKWMFRDILHANERELIIDLWPYSGPKGICPSLETLSNETGYGISRLCQLLNGIEDKEISCPVCGSTYKILEIKSKAKKDKINSSNQYNLKPLQDFLEHIDRLHFKDDIQKKDKTQEQIDELEHKLELFREPYNLARAKLKQNNKEKREKFPEKMSDF